jgi:hypothetical protein
LQMFHPVYFGQPPDALIATPPGRCRLAQRHAQTLAVPIDQAGAFGGRQVR